MMSAAPHATSAAPRSKARSGLLPVALLAVVLLGIPLVVKDSFFIHSCIVVLFFAYMATSWNFVCGYVGQLSIGHSMFAGMGGYATVLLFTQAGLSPWLGLPVGGLLAALLSVAVGYPTFRLKGPYFALTTIAFAEMIRIWVENTDSFLGIPLNGAAGLTVPLLGENAAAMQFNDKVPYYYIIVALLGGALFATWLLENAKLGFYLKAIRGDIDAAESLGISPGRYQLIALAISAFMTGMGGGFYAQFYRYVNAERLIGVDLSIDMALMSIIGGQGTIFGPLLGALLLAPMAEITRSYLGGSLLGLHIVVYGIILILAVLYLPKGLIDPLRRIVGRLNGRETGR
jgi:branched-chain amino acid transport system permease protein